MAGGQQGGSPAPSELPQTTAAARGNLADWRHVGNVPTPFYPPVLKQRPGATNSVDCVYCVKEESARRFDKLAGGQQGRSPPPLELPQTTGAARFPLTEFQQGGTLPPQSWRLLPRCWGTVRRPCPAARPQVSLRSGDLRSGRGHGPETMPQRGGRGHGPETGPQRGGWERRRRDSLFLAQRARLE